jgi:tetratricopeptide (TPR) repeat protein
MKDSEAIVYMDLVALAQKFESEGRYEAAESLALQAVQIAPQLPAAHSALAQIRLRLNRWQEADESFRRAHLLRRAPRSASVLAVSRQPLPAAVMLGRLRRDVEQFQYLVEKKRIPRSNRVLLQALLKYLDSSELAGQTDGAVGIDRSVRRFMRDFSGKAYHLFTPEALPRGALNPRLDFRAIQKAYFAKNRRLAVIDTLLRPEALALLRRFCLESTIYYDTKLTGYAGAYLNDGFSCGLLHQIASELQQYLPEIYEKHALRIAWSFQYDSLQTGTGLHADKARVNANLWLTPDRANLNPDTGGIIVWLCKAPESWNFRSLNSYELGAEAQRHRWLLRSKAKRIRIPYRQNRMVLFDSKYLHKTDEYMFLPGYENRRMNITLLHGDA